MYFGEVEGAGFEVIDERFEACFVPHARVERLWTGARWSEGPAWFAAGRFLLWSDIPNNRMLRFDETSNAVSAFREPSNNSNGNAVDNFGRLVTCEHLTRRVTRTEFDGRVTVLADRFDGKRLNSPNDVTVKSDGSVWFTDPDYGIGHDYEGDYADPEYGSRNVFRVDPDDGRVEVVSDTFERPNGLAFSPDERYLYVSDTGVTHNKAGPRHIRRLKVGPDGRGVGEDMVFAECDNGLFDGFRVDTNGLLWCSARDGVHVYAADGTRIGKVRIPEMVANLTFGGAKRNRLFICGTTSLYAAYVVANGASNG